MYFTALYFMIYFQQELEQLQTKLSLSKTAMEQLQSENMKLEVRITTLQSQSNSLTAQHTALQLANSQLVAEKEEVFTFFLIILSFLRL